MLRCLLVTKYVHVHRFIMIGTVSRLLVHTSWASTVPEASYSSVLFYSHICCWLYYMGFFAYGKHLFYLNNSLCMCDWLQDAEYRCMWQLFHNSTSVCSMVKPVVWSWWGEDLHKVMLAGICLPLFFSFPNTEPNPNASIKHRLLRITTCLWMCESRPFYYLPLSLLFRKGVGKVDDNCIFN